MACYLGEQNELLCNGRVAGLAGPNGFTIFRSREYCKKFKSNGFVIEKEVLDFLALDGYSVIEIRSKKGTLKISVKTWRESPYVFTLDGNKMVFYDG